MTSLNKIVKNKKKIKPVKKKKLALAACPQKKATCLKIFNMNPRKPNSADRKVS